MRRKLNKAALQHNEDWYGNNAAIFCPVCNKTYIVSGFLNKGCRQCPQCGRSFAQLTADSVMMEWREQQDIPTLCTRSELEKKNRLNDFVGLVQTGGAVDETSIQNKLPRAREISFIDRDGKMIAAAAMKEPATHYAQTVSYHSGYQLPNDTQELGYVVVDSSARGQKLSSAVVESILLTIGCSSIFATTSDAKIKRLLSKNGFRWVGHEWKSDRTGELLSLWVRGDITSSMTDENIYREAFFGKKGENALEKALDIRKFEIGLYWQRAAYFWALIAAAFAGYCAILSAEHLWDKEYLAYIVGCIGFFFTWAWFLVNRGSKYWQENWENHVDMLEDAVTGPLYKTTLHRSNPTTRIEKYVVGPENISVSKVNQWVSCFTMCMWVGLIVHALWPFEASPKWLVRHLVAFIVMFSFCCLMKKHGTTHKNHPPRRMERRDAHIS
jgi:predicted GNAT family N-acyltransferase